MQKRFPYACAYTIYNSNNNTLSDNDSDSESDSDSHYDSLLYTFLRKVRNAVFSFSFRIGLGQLHPTPIDNRVLETKHHYSSEL